MNYRDILVTGGAGFVGSSLSISLKTRRPAIRIVAADNLKRRGSELNLPRLRSHDIEFVHADIRNPEDVFQAGHDVDLIPECSAEPSVPAGHGGTPDYVVNTNLLGTVKCLELARRTNAHMLFLSTSRVYPLRSLNSIDTREEVRRIVIAPEQTIPGVYDSGISEQFPLDGPRSRWLRHWFAGRSRGPREFWNRPALMFRRFRCPFIATVVSIPCVRTRWTDSGHDWKSALPGQRSAR